MNMVDIDYAAFRRLDLNLLVAFDALVSEASVSRAAARLFVGQPAMSHALARLRETFGDDILFRDGAGMRPTPRALALAGAVRQVLDDIQHLARGARAFDPAEAEGRVRIALTDPLEALLLPGLVARLRARARARPDPVGAADPRVTSAGATGRGGGDPGGRAFPPAARGA